jgi:hypothetical protein
MPPEPVRKMRALRSAGFQTCCIADFQVGKALRITWFAGLETRDTRLRNASPRQAADLEVCATVPVARCASAETTLRPVVDTEGGLFQAVAL